MHRVDFLGEVIRETVGKDSKATGVTQERVCAFLTTPAVRSAKFCCAVIQSGVGHFTVKCGF